MSLPRASGDEVGHLQERVAAEGVAFVLLQIVDLHGRPSAKLVSSDRLGEYVVNGAAFAGVGAGELGRDSHEADVLALPDPDSFTVLPWRPDVGWLACDVTVDGAPWHLCPRTILRRQLAHVAKRGYSPKVGAEPEYYLLRRDAAGGLTAADAADSLRAPCYDARALSGTLDFVTETASHMERLGWGHLATDHEAGNGQFEQNFDFDDALRTCDRIVFFRLMVHELARRRGLTATFMPKPFADRSGNGCHLHLSLWTSGRNRFADAGQDAYGLGLSELGYSFIAGLLAHAGAHVAVTAPTVNSYRRLCAVDPAGDTWAPRYVAYGPHNRTAMIRIPAPGRLEERTPDGASNPYLAVAALLASGMDGVERELDPGQPTVLPLRSPGTAPALPGNLLDAVRALDSDEILRSALGGGFVDAYVAVKTREWEEAQREVTRWELDRYLGLF